MKLSCTTEKKIAVVVPARQVTELLIGRVTETTPELADKIVTNDECSSDNTCCCSGIHKKILRELFFRHEVTGMESRQL